MRLRLLPAVLLLAAAPAPWTGIEAVFMPPAPPVNPVLEAVRLANRTEVHTAGVEAAQAAREAAEAAAHEEWHRQQEAARTAHPEPSGKTVWDRLAKCESGGVWSINTGNGYFGGLQFSLSSWRATGGSGYPHQHSRSEQIKRAEVLLSMQGWGAWPACSRKLGLR